MARILCLCPSHRDRRELPRYVNGHELRFHEYASVELEQLTVPGETRDIRVGGIAREIDVILDGCRRHGVDAVVSTDDYPGAALASVIAREAGLVAPSPRSSLVCQHKYLSRQVQARAAADCAAACELIDVNDAHPDVAYPVFVKPVKSFFSAGAAHVDGPSALEGHVRRWKNLQAFFDPFDALLGRYTGHRLGGGYLVAEGVLRGAQATLECFVHAGEAQALGVVDSVFHDGTLAFERFEYPSSLPPEVQERMLERASRVLRATGFDNGLANVEFMYHEASGALAIVEINPRMSSQFADLFEKVDGTNSYEVLLDLALGRKPRVRRRAGRHRFAASCVLRCFEDRWVAKVPSAAEVEAASRTIPDARVEVLAEEGQRLSGQMQDDCSFRYGVVNLGGRNREDVVGTFRRLRRELRFEFATDV